MDTPKVSLTCTGLVWTARVAQIGCANFHTLRQPFHKPNEPGSERLFVHYDWCSFVPTLSPRGRRSPHVIVTRQEIAHRRTLSCDRTSDWLDPTLACTKDIHFLRVYSITTQFRILFVHFASPRCACIE